MDSDQLESSDNSESSSRHMHMYDSGTIRDVGGKGRCDLLPHSSILRVSVQMEDSLSKYPENNWKKGMPLHCSLDSAMRHLMKYMDGYDDEDHLAAAATNLLMAMWTEDHLPLMCDIESRSESTDRSYRCAPSN